MPVVVTRTLVAQWANAGVYDNTGANSIAPIGRVQLHAVHHLLAASVSIFHSFLRPFGVALTEETLREVAQMDNGSVRQELYDIYDNLVTAATKTYQLVRTMHIIVYLHVSTSSTSIFEQIKNDIDIHECYVPYLPANTNVIPRPVFLHHVSLL